MLLHLPEHVLFHIFKHLCLQDIHSLILTCKTLHNIIIKDNILWKSIAQGLQQSISYDSYNRPTRLILKTRDIDGYFRQKWYNNCRASYNWCKGFYKSQVILQHRINYMPWIKLYKSEILLITIGTKLYCYAVSGTPNCKHLLWKIEVPQIERNDIRTNDITRFMFNDDYLVCGNRDGSTAVYKVDHNIRFKPQLIDHINNCHEDGELEVTAVEFIKSTNGCCVVTASNDSSSVKFWHQQNGCRDDQPLKNYMETNIDENMGIRCLAVNNKGDKLAIGPNGNNKPLIIDTFTGGLLITNDDTINRKQAVRDIQWHDDNTVLYVTHSGRLQLFDVRNNEVVYTAVDPFQSTLYCVKTDGHRAFIAGSSEYSRCVLFDICSPLHVQMYFTQKRSSPVYCLDFNTSTLITAVDRGVAVLNFDVLASTTCQHDYSDIFQSY